MDIPEPIAAAGIAGAPVRHKWSTPVSDALMYPDEDTQPRLAHAMETIGERAAFGLAMALAEWVAWRCHGLIDIADALARIEAGYAAVIDPRYAVLPMPDEPFPKDRRELHGPLKQARMIISDAHADLSTDPDPVNGWAFRMALLAKHVVPQQAALEAWLTAALKRTFARYPLRDEPLSTQAPVARAFFFDPDSVAGDDLMRRALDDFLAGLDPSANPYLRTAAQLHALGFAGTPYRYP